MEFRSAALEDMGRAPGEGPVTGGGCRHCGATLERSFCDLGASPLANSYLTAADLGRPEKFYPLHAFVCGSCFLVQLQEFESPEAIFGDYAYFSSFSTSWLDHARRYTEEMMARFALDGSSQIVEVASNDGYLLQYFAARHIQVLGIEPAANIADAAEKRGVPTVARFFNTETARWLVDTGRQADLLVGNNVLAHVPDLNDFVRGLKIAIKPHGRITLEFPYLRRLIAENQFDTIYHEHFSYFSLVTVTRVFATHGLRLFDVQQLPTHGGSLRVFACHAEDRTHPDSGAVEALLAEERTEGLDRLDTYRHFSGMVARTKRRLLQFLLKAKDEGRTVVGYGAPAKGNTLLNYCGVKPDLIDYTVDRSPHKQGRYLPGTRIPIFGPERIRETKPDYVLVLPWNLETEITQQMAEIREWGGRFVIPIPEVRIV